MERVGGKEGTGAGSSRCVGGLGVPVLTAASGPEEPSAGAAVSEAVVNSETCQSASPSRLTVPKTIWGIDRWNMVMPSKA